MTCKIMVITAKLAPHDGSGQVPQWEVESTKVIDHDNSSDRKWLGAHCFWAMRNDRKVITHPESL